jgi:plastocyanin
MHPRESGVENVLTAVAIAAAVCCGGQADHATQPAPVAAVAITPSSPSLLVEDTVQLQAVATDAAGHELSGRTALWTVDDPSVADIVLTTGELHGRGAGTTVVRAKVENQEAAATVTVRSRPVASVRIEPGNDTSLRFGETRALNAILLDDHGHAAFGRKIDWEFSPPGILRVITVHEAAATVAALSAGSGRVVASAEGKADTVIIEVKPVAATITISPASVDTLFSKGDQVQLSALVRDASGNVIPAADLDVAWRSGLPFIATVDPHSGVVTANSTGSVVVTATADTTSGTVTIPVRQRPAAIRLEPASLSLEVGQAKAVFATAVDARGNDIPSGTQIAYRVVDATVASVSFTGIVLGVGVGTTAVVAEVMESGHVLAATTQVTVTPGEQASVSVAALAFTPDTARIVVGGTVLWRNPLDGEVHDIVFEAVPGAPANVEAADGFQVVRVFNSVGTFPYQCTIHPEMRGVVIVSPRTP